MTDITTVWDVARSQGDWVLSGAALASGDDLSTALWLSVFTDRLADATDTLPDGSDDRRGWWGDEGQVVPMGSRLWLLARAKLLPATAVAAKGYLVEALQWLMDDGVAGAVDVVTSIVRPRQLTAVITITRPDGSRLVIRFNWAWDQRFG